MFRGLELRRVVAAPPQAEPDVKVLTIEIYEDGLIVRYAAARWEDARWFHTRTSQLAVHDDLGTTYRRESGSAASTEGGSAHGIAEFTPTVPSCAQTLTVSTSRGAVEIPLGE